jgi:hypothetical protein
MAQSQTQQQIRNQTVTNISELATRVTHEAERNSEAPNIILLGEISKTINIDGTVVSRIGQVGGVPAYWAVPRAYKITEEGLHISDDHPDWFAENNDEEVVIPEADIELGFLCTTGGSIGDNHLADTPFVRK